MIISDKYKFIFLHIPKTGGSSISAYLNQFLGKNDGLIIAEVELEYEMQNIELPDWIDIEVSNESKYYNYNLAINPYSNWKGE